LGPVASECPEGQLHINAERFIVEIVQDGIPVPPGVEGEIVITDLVNYGFPMIRYATGDIGIIGAKPCSCGRCLPVLEKISGRAFDYIPSPSGIKILATHMDGIFDKFPQRIIKQIQLFQPAIDQMTVRIVPGPDYTPDFNENVLGLAKSIFAKLGVNVNLELCDRIMMTKSGKYQFYERGF
jgi:phenylacetate-CoA ligase